MNIYCGNNASNPQLLNNTLQLGTRYSCMKKGIGKALNSPIDYNYTTEYTPIDNRKIYCGNKTHTPNGYHYVGNLPQCLQKGIGIGKKIRAEQEDVTNSNGFSPVIINKPILIHIFILIFIATALFLLLYYTKPRCLTKKIKENNYQIIWWKFLLFYLSLIFIIIIIYFYLCK